MIQWAPVITRRFLLCSLPRFAHVTPAAIQYAGNRMKMSLTLRLALLRGLIAAPCLCWAASKPKPLTAYDPEAKALLARMTLDEKIGQMTQPRSEERRVGKECR